MSVVFYMQARKSICPARKFSLKAHPAESLAGGDGRRDGGGRGPRGGGYGRGPRKDEGSNGTAKAGSGAAADLPFPVIVARRLFTAESAIVSFVCIPKPTALNIYPRLQESNNFRVRKLTQSLS